MAFGVPVPTPLSYFGALVASDVQFPLLEAAACLAQDEYPELDVQQVLGDMDQLQARLRRRLPADAAPSMRLRTLNHFFYQDLGFGCNVNNYYDPDNSYLNAVLRTRRGIPVSLAVLWMELAQGLGLNARGVSFPGHFLVKVGLSMGQVVIDPVNGESLSREGLSERLAPYRHPGAAQDDFEALLGLHLQACAPREIVARMLRNLKEIHRTQEDWGRLVAVQDRLLLLLPQDWTGYRDRGLAHAEQGHGALALADLEIYLRHARDALDRDAISERIMELRRAGG